VKRILSGSLEHLAPTALLRLVSATSPSGVLELDTADGSLRLEVDRGRVKMPSSSELASAGQILACRRGEFRFSPHGVPPHEGEVLSLTAFAEAASGAASNLEVDRLLKEELLEISQPLSRTKIHVLPSEPPRNPLGDLLADLEIIAVPEHGNREVVLGIDLDEGDVCLGIGPPHLRLVASPVGEGHLDVVGILDDVVVGDDVAVRAQHKP